MVYVPFKLQLKSSSRDECAVSCQSECVCRCVCVSVCVLSCSVSAKATVEMVSDQFTISQEYQGVV